MPDCKSCENQKWKEMYIMSQQKFDAIITKLTIGFIILSTVTIVCFTVAAFLLAKTQKFINEFEYVEETEMHIEQDCRGNNTIVLPNGEEVITDGSGSNGDKEEVLEKEENKINSIYINK